MGLRDVRELVKSFEATEDQNFALFRYVQSLNEDIALMEEESHKVESKLTSAHQKQGKASDTRDAKVEAMRDKVARCGAALDGVGSDLGRLRPHRACAPPPPARRAG